MHQPGQQAEHGRGRDRRARRAGWRATATRLTCPEMRRDQRRAGDLGGERHRHRLGRPPGQPARRARPGTAARGTGCRRWPAPTARSRRRPPATGRTSSSTRTADAERPGAALPARGEPIPSSATEPIAAARSDARLGTRQQHEAGHPQRTDHHQAAGAHPDPAGEHQQEADDQGQVGAGDRGQVGEPAGPEVGDHLLAHLPGRRPSPGPAPAPARRDRPAPSPARIPCRTWPRRRAAPAGRRHHGGRTARVERPGEVGAVGGPSRPAASTRAPSGHVGPARVADDQHRDPGGAGPVRRAHLGDGEPGQHERPVPALVDHRVGGHAGGRPGERRRRRAASCADRARGALASTRSRATDADRRGRQQAGGAVPAPRARGAGAGAAAPRPGQQRPRRSPDGSRKPASPAGPGGDAEQRASAGRGRSVARRPAHKVTNGRHLGQRRVADAGHVEQLVDGGERHRSRCATAGSLRGDRPHPGQGLQLALAGGVDVDQGAAAPPVACGAPAADAATPAGAGTPTTTCSPSTSTRARFSECRLTPRRAPPAALIASTTREPSGSVAMPGRRTLPVDVDDDWPPATGSADGRRSRDRTASASGHQRRTAGRWPSSRATLGTGRHRRRCGQHGDPPRGDGQRGGDHTATTVSWVAPSCTRPWSEARQPVVQPAAEPAACRADRRACRPRRV